MFEFSRGGYDKGKNEGNNIYVGKLQRLLGHRLINRDKAVATLAILSVRKMSEMSCQSPNPSD